MSTVKLALADARRRLAGLSDNDPDLDARILLCHVLAKPPTWLYGWPEHALAPQQQAAFDRLVARRADGVPVAHLTGRREFWGLDLSVNPSTLIPRPDTERLVDVALRLGDERVPAHAGLDVLDLGTGSGAIALAIGHERPDWRVTATDAASDALALAAANAERLGQRLRLFAGDWFDAVPTEERFDLIVSNPPYIPSADPHLTQGDVRHEPRTALVAGDDGLDDLRRIVAAAPARLKADGWLIVEHGFDQAAAVAQLMSRAGLCDIDRVRDFGDRDRVSIGRYRPTGC